MYASYHRFFEKQTKAEANVSLELRKTNILVLFSSFIYSSFSIRANNPAKLDQLYWSSAALFPLVMCF